MSNPSGYNDWPRKSTLCWDCKNAVGWCSWSREFEPVNGWDAEYKPNLDSYLVNDCPEFERDACCSGMKRIGGKG